MLGRWLRGLGSRQLEDSDKSEAELRGLGSQREETQS